MAMMWAGKVGAGCGPHGCSPDCPTKAEPLMVECPCCHEAGCELCTPMGRFELDCCPRRYVDGWYWTLFKFGTLFRKGVPPIAGGALEQESWFLDACEFLWSEQDRLVPSPLLM